MPALVVSLQALPDRIVSGVLHVLQHGQTTWSVLQLLHICRQWRAMLIKQLSANYTMQVGTQAEPGYSLWPAYFPQPGKQCFSLVTQLTVSVDYNCIFNGKGSHAIYKEYTNQLVFPHASHLILSVQHITDDKDVLMHDYDSNAHVFGKCIKQMVPKVQKISVQHSTFTEVKDMPTDHSFNAMLIKLYRNTQYSAMLLNYNDFIYSYQPEIGHPLSKLDCCWNENYMQMLPLIHTSAETLIELKLTCHGMSRDKLTHLFHSNYNHYIVYYNLEKLVFAKSTSWSTVDRPILASCAFLPKLRHLYLGIVYPFGDDLLFRGCSNTLEYLYITPDLFVLQMLDRYSVFAQGKFNRLEQITVADNTSNDSYLAAAVTEFVHRASPALRIANIHEGKAGEKLLCAVVQSMQMATLQALYIKNSQLSMADVAAMLNALPQLSELYCMCIGLGDEYSSVPFMRLAEHLHQSYYPLNRAFRKWEIVHNYSMPLTGNKAAKDMACCTMLVAILCPKFIRADINALHKRPYNGYVKQAVAMNPGGRFAGEFERLLQPV